ncbi:condensin complex component cnd1 [Myriangium duriaei CBS 260.36]|uniref:Condensin complex subunit 1 n=1 Tax=Myriangium duriaei CBS 260.36 TaxID=1168546 RepID=A0A9P4MQ13_9PEZI|nr:condensin complex component cnd1 [Myriangium duriaei CBS 260.36]
MEALVDFDINEALKRYKDDPATVNTPDAGPALIDCDHDPETLTAGIVNSVLNPIVDAVAENSDALARASIFDSIQYLLKQSAAIPASSLSKILDLLISGIVSQADSIHNDLEAEEQDALQHQKRILQMYGFLLQWALSCVDSKSNQEKAAAPAARKGLKAAKFKSNLKETTWDPSSQTQAVLEAMVKVMRLKLLRVFVATSERDTFISMFTRPVYLLLENEARVKTVGVRMHCFRVLCVAIKHHGHAAGAQTSIDQCLSYFEHLSEPMAEFLNILADQYDYPQLAEEVLKELSNKEFNNNDLKGPKSVSTFIAKLSELAPRLVIKQVMLLAKLLDSESYTLRCAIIEVCGNLIAMLSKQEDDDRSENSKGQLNAFFDVLEERFLDINPYCRCRAIQVYIKLCDLETKYPKRRQTAAELAARSLEDKSSNVRRNAIKLLGKLVSTHPFSVLHGGQLSHAEWNARLEACEAELNALKPPEGNPGLGEQAEPTVDEDLLDDATQASPVKEKSVAPQTEEEKEADYKKAAEEAANAEMMSKLGLTRRYYVEALKFIEVIHSASPVAIQLLGSKNKSEVIETMDFFVIADAYKIETARSGIRRMLRLIWTKGNSDEGKGVQAHLIECYKGLFFDAPDHFSANDAANYVARNMISLTFGATSAELTSLEQLLSTMMKNDMIKETVIQKLWQVYGVQKKEISKTQRRGSIIALGMLALADPEIIVKEMETCLRIGLGKLGRSDLGLARYTCLALTRMNATKQTKGTAAAPSTRLDNDHAVLQRLAAITQVQTTSKEWFGLAEQAIAAIYSLSKHPDALCSDIVRIKTKSVFSQSQSEQPAPEEDAMDVDMMDVDEVEQDQAPTVATPPEGNQDQSAVGLSQLLFTVGHVAIKQIVHLELCEQDFKRRKMEKDKLSAKPAPSPAQKDGKKGKSDAKQEEQDELDLIAGTNEDDFTEAIQHVRERELLFGQQSLLANFGPLAREICSNNTSYPNRDLQAQAALCMAKLMCVSSEYCEQNLALLITILERSHDATARSNLVVALGDMAVCFNHLIDENTDYLYRRLSDPSLPVKRTCLMTLTFLILAGQVKVKGQLGEMAKCVEDEDEQVREMSRMFFGELAGKDNAVYNNFVDMFSLLSSDQSLDEEQFKRIIKFLSAFIEKDKHAKQLAGKLAVRLGRADSERQWNDVAYALGLLQHKDEEIAKMVGEGFKTVQAAA